MQKVSQLEVKRGREFLQILQKIDGLVGRIGIKLTIGFSIVFIVIGLIITMTRG